MAVVVLGRVHSLLEVWTILLEDTLALTVDFSAVEPQFPQCTTRHWLTVPGPGTGRYQTRENQFINYVQKFHFSPQRYLTLVRTYQHL